MKLKVKDMIYVSIFAALMVVGAYIRIPFPVIPITLQPFFCALAGIMIGSRLAFTSQIIYIALGLAGLPVFAKGGGITYIFQPSFGFILGFALCAYVVGKISERQQSINIKGSLISLFSGLASIYALGIPFMYMILRFYKNNPDATVWYIITMNLPFLIKDLVLYIIIAITSVTVVPIVKRASSVHLS